MNRTTDWDSSYSVQAPVQQEQKWQGFMQLHPGQKLWCFNMTTKILDVVDLTKDKTFDMSTGDLTQSSKVMTAEDLVFVAAINRDNAMKKVLARFGWRWDKKLRTGVPMFEEIKLAPEVVEINKPIGGEIDMLDDDPDAVSDNKDPFEDDGAYAEDYKDE